MASGAHGPKPDVFGSPTGSALFAKSPVFMQETFLCRRELTIRNEFRDQFDQYCCGCAPLSSRLTPLQELIHVSLSLSCIDILILLS